MTRLLTCRQRNCLAWFRGHEPQRAMSGLKAHNTFDSRTLSSLVRRGLLTFSLPSGRTHLFDGVYRLNEQREGAN